MKRLLQWSLLLVLLASLRAIAQDAGAGEVKKVEVFPSPAEVRIEITLSAAAVPAVETAQHPDRLVVKLPGTTSQAQQKRIPVQQMGVRMVRFGLNQANPPETHLVVDLDEEHPYRVTSDGVKITVFIQPSLREEAKKRVAPAAAASKPLINSLGRGSQSDSESLNAQKNNSDGTLLTPPPSGPPIQFPSAPKPESSVGTSTTASSGAPSARHPNYGSLQQGTVFPGAGAPGSGVVPAVSGTPQGGPIEAASSQPSTAGNPAPSAAVPSASTASTSQEATGGNTSVAQSQVESNTGKPVAPARSGQEAKSAPPQPVIPPQSLPAPSSVSAGMTASVVPPAAAPNVAPDAGSQGKASSENAVAASAPQATTQPQQAAQESKPAVTPAVEVPAPAQQASGTPVPEATEQAAESNDQEAAASAESASANQPADEGSGSGRMRQITRRDGENTDFRTAFRVKFVAQDTAYLDGGRGVGLMEGMKLVVRDLPNAGGVAAEGANSDAAGDVAELEVLSVAENSAVTEIHTPKRPVKVGDLAYLSMADQQALVEKNALSATRKYPAVVSFTENDTLDEEAREEIPKPPSPAVNRSRGRIGFNYIGVLDHGPTNIYTNNVGLVVRTDISRIGGSYWNASGYWNGRFDHTSNTGPQTLQDTINRTYTLYTYYDNPHSSWVAGFGRLYLPYATSLDTIDGGYAGRKLSQGVTSGVFFGSTPDPTSWSYAPGRQMGGAFVNFEGGSFDDFHYTSTAGAGLQMLSFTPDRPFVFFENTISYKRVFSIYQASQIDTHASHTYACPVANAAIPECVGETFNGSTYTGGTWTQAGTSWGLGRSFTTVRFAPHPRIEFSVNNTYYRDLPFIDPSNLTSGGIGAGLFDKFLSQGTTGGVRVEVLKQIWLSTDLGLSNFSGESKNSLNQIYGITFGHVPWVNAHLDARYSKFNSTFGSGHYESLSFTRNLNEGLQIQVLAGQQNFTSSLTSATQSRFVNGMLESNLGRHYFVQVGGTLSRGNQMNYDQWLFTFGYRFDNRQGQKAK